MNTTVIFVMVAGIFNIATVNWIVFEQQHLALKRKFERQLKAGIPDDQLIVFKFSPSEESQLNWKHEREFIYNGEYYDVVSVQLVEGQKVIRCISDHAEHEIEELAEDLAGRSDQNVTKEPFLLKYIPGLAYTQMVSAKEGFVGNTIHHVHCNDQFTLRFFPQPPDWNFLTEIS
ncbi:MAG: hypothetical protein IPP69_11190 [Flavobacteriales bacterium]|nr:hypothetical protein [Flavobacteriales bacterium]